MCAAAAPSCMVFRPSRASARSTCTVLWQLYEVLQSALLQATAQAMADAELRHRQQVAACEKAAERARFEADRAMLKHDEVKPGNRLVARTLKARLEERLAALPSGRFP